jgi:hypothetical protein
MSISQSGKNQDDAKKPPKRRSGRVNMVAGQHQPDNDLGSLMQELEAVDETKPTAKLNKTTISDNNGGRIELDDKKRRSTVVNMMDWVHEENLEQWKKDHSSEQGDGSRTS